MKLSFIEGVLYIEMSFIADSTVSLNGLCIQCMFDNVFCETWWRKVYVYTVQSFARSPLECQITLIIAPWCLCEIEMLHMCNISISESRNLMLLQ